VIKSRNMSWVRNVTSTGNKRGVHRILVGTSDGKRPLGRRRRRWEDNIKIDIQEVGWGSSGSRQGQLAGCCKCGIEPSSCVKCWEFLDWLRISKLHRKDSLHGVSSWI